MVFSIIDVGDIIMFVEVLIQISAKAVDQYYVYKVPKVFRDNIKIGIRVRIPFGKMELEGFVMNILNDTDYDKSKIRDISDVVDDRPVLNKEMILLGKYMSKHLLCSLVSAYQVMLPKALKAKNNVVINKKYETFYKLNKKFSYKSLLFFLIVWTSLFLSVSRGAFLAFTVCFILLVFFQRK